MSEEKDLRQEQFETMTEKPMLAIGDVRIISEEDETFLDDKLKEIQDFMANNDGSDKSEEEKDNLYMEAQRLWGELSGTTGKLNFVNFNIVLNRDQYQYLTGLLRDKFEYDVDPDWEGCNDGEEDKTD